MEMCMKSMIMDTIECVEFQIFCRGIKTQMGTTLASCSHFVTHGLLLLWRQATVIVVGCIFLSILLAHFVNLFSTHRFWVLPFTALPSSCPFGFPCGPPSRTECYTKYNMIHHLRSEFLSYETFPTLQLLCSPESFAKLAFPSFFRSLTQPSNERPAFFSGWLNV
jgi:hypothetical protein